MVEIEKFNAIEVSDDKIILASSDDIVKVYNLIKDNQDFILSYDNEEGEHISKLFYAGDMDSKFKNRNLEISSKENKK